MEEGDDDEQKPIHFSDFILTTRLLDHYKKSSCSVIPTITPTNEIWLGQHKRGYEALVFKCRKYNSQNLKLHKAEINALKHLQNVQTIMYMACQNGLHIYEIYINTDKVHTFRPCCIWVT